MVDTQTLVEVDKSMTDISFPDVVILLVIMYSTCTIHVLYMYQWCGGVYSHSDVCLAGNHIARQTTVNTCQYDNPQQLLTFLYQEDSPVHTITGTDTTSYFCVVKCWKVHLY